MVSSSDSWIRELSEASRLADDISSMISERGSFPPSAPDTQHHTASIRRKITILGTRLDSLDSLLSKLPKQNEGLEKLQKTVMSTKHIALAVNEELDLHTRLIDDLDQHVDVTDSRLQRVQKKLGILNKRTKGGC